MIFIFGVSSQFSVSPVRANACRGCGLFERVTAVPERKGHKTQHEWVLVSKSLTLLPAEKSFDDFPSEKENTFMQQFRSGGVF